MPEFLIGTGGWGYFRVPKKPSLKAYSEVFNFVEVNYTFYQYPDIRLVEGWRKTVPKDFTFSVRCHQDLTHRIGLKAVDEAYQVFEQMLTYCRILDSPFLVLETSAGYLLDNITLNAARDFFASVSFKGVRVVWEIRAPVIEQAVELMNDFNIIHCMDISINKPTGWSDVGYARIFGKGKHNLWQFTDEELQTINRNASENKAEVVALSFHSARMVKDILRFSQFKLTSNFPQVTPFTGLDSARSVLNEDAIFPSSKQTLINDQGWKIYDESTQKRIHLSELLSKLPEKTYFSIDEVIKALESK